jgi:hypothetical protein
MKSKMKVAAIFILLLGVLALGWYAPRDRREQIVVLEQFSTQLERAQEIPPETEQYANQLISSFRQGPPADTKLQQRQTTAINRIEAVLSGKTGALPQNNVVGSIPAESNGVFPVVCAQRDANAVLLIEEHGEVQDIAAEKLANAYLTMLTARTACGEGRVADALAIYDKVIAFGPVLSLRAQ